jgi:hypothetical protein
MPLPLYFLFLVALFVAKVACRGSPTTAGLMRSHVVRSSMAVAYSGCDL